ncbi:MAG: LytR C-terminal domain-containing protein, partial [Acidimicrobiales bacterium]|nr:LytR C-terminal domain-containing protein [Acidimicrobiales bacterium]
GSILLLPVETRMPGDETGSECEVACRLLDQHRDGGLEAVRIAMASILDVQVTGATLLTPARWESLAGAVAPVAVTLAEDLVATAADGTSVVRFPAGTVSVAATDVVDLFGFPGGGLDPSTQEDVAERSTRQQDWWRGWMDALHGGDPRDRLPKLDLDVIDLLATVARGRVRIVSAPWVDDGAAVVVDGGRMTDVVVEMFPFPIPRVPGLRPSVRLLNGTGDPSVDGPSREAVLRAGVELAVVGNYRNDGVIQTRVIHRDPAQEAAAEALAAAIGGGVLFDQYLSPVTDLTVVIGADFLLRG